MFIKGSQTCVCKFMTGSKGERWNLMNSLSRRLMNNVYLVYFGCCYHETFFLNGVPFELQFSVICSLGPWFDFAFVSEL